MKSANSDGFAIYPRLHNQYIDCVYPKYCDYNGWNFPRRTLGSNTGKLLLFNFNGMLFTVKHRAKFCRSVSPVFWCLVIGPPSNLPVRHDRRTDDISGS